MAIRYIITVANTTDRANQLRNLGLNVAGIAFRRDSNTLDVLDPDTGTVYSIPVTGQVANGVAGVAAGYALARGLHRQVAAADTVVTGLAAVVATVVSFDDAPTVKQLFVRGTIGDQAGAPAAGSIVISTFKPTAVNDVTPTPATDFTDTLDFGWIAIGTL